jgi:hypothetical protein
MATVTRPSTFRRSSERNIGEAELRAWAFSGAAEEDRRRDEFEALSYGVSGAAAGGLVVRTSITDDSHFDLEGRVYP